MPASQSERRPGRVKRGCNPQMCFIRRSVEQSIIENDVTAELVIFDVGVEGDGAITGVFE